MIFQNFLNSCYHIVKLSFTSCIYFLKSIIFLVFESGRSVPNKNPRLNCNRLGGPKWKQSFLLSYFWKSSLRIEDLSLWLEKLYQFFLSLKLILQLYHLLLRSNITLWKLHRLWIIAQSKLNRPYWCWQQILVTVHQNQCKQLNPTECATMIFK